MGQLLGTLVGVAVGIGAILGAFVGLNALIDLAPKRFPLFAILAGALVGAVVGALANSGGWFLGGPLWPLGGAVVGAGVGILWGHRPPSPERQRSIPDRFRPAIFLGPALLFLFVALVVPTIRTVYLSFRSPRGDQAAGFENYRSVFGDEGIFTLNGLGNVFTSRLFVVGVAIAVVAVVLNVVRGRASGRGVDLTAPIPSMALLAGGTLVLLAGVGALRGVVWTNVYWVVFVTLFSTTLGLAIAWLADRSRGESVAKSLIFMPMAISFVGASVIWRFVYAFTPAGHDQIGLLNAAWVGLGGQPQAWIQQLPWNTLFLIAIMIWVQTGFAMVVLSASIKAVPTELLEAARVDGATEGQTFWRVTLPQIVSTLGVVSVTLIITVLKVYDVVKVMTNGEFGTNVIANQMFDEAFINRNLGRGSALAALLFLAVVPLMILNVRRMRREAVR
ncbi:MAG: putative alpha-glucoside transporter permease protein [Acidimicrobiales bacterium]|jgi:alpha-glucoside transport system permease protein|nr:putative alpha-glucoside transporter permease protein [Acidimicrobiales bacterium]